LTSLLGYNSVQVGFIAFYDLKIVDNGFLTKVSWQRTF